MRLGSIELYRCILMFGICLLHAITQGGHQIRGLDNALLPCVDGFVFVSGYFGIKVSVKKLIRLLCTAAICYLTSFWLFSAYRSSITVVAFADGMKQYWFLWAYVVLMFLSPILENVRFKTAWGLLFCVFFWGYLTQVPYVKSFVPRPIGFGQYTFFTLMGAYVCGRLWRAYESNIKRIDRRVLCCCLVLLFCLNWLGMGHYHSPTAVMFAAVSFSLIKEVKLSCTMERIVCYLSPSMFSVYLLHTTENGFRVLRLMENYFVEEKGVVIWVAWLVVATSLFALCVVIDCLRRFLSWICCREVNKLRKNF